MEHVKFLFAYGDPHQSHSYAETEAKMDISAFLFCLFMNEDLVEKWPALILGFIIIRDAKIAYEKLESEVFSMDFGAALSCV